MGIGESTEKAIDLLLTTFVNSKSEALCMALVPLAITGTTIHLILIALSIARGEVDDPVNELVRKFLRTSFIAGLALSAGSYQLNVLAFVSGLEAELMHAMSGFTSVGPLIDNTAEPFTTLGLQIWNKAVVGFWPNFGLVCAAATVAIAEFLLIAIGLGLYLLAKIGLALTLALGPAYLLCAIWPSTEKYTESWIGQALNFVVLKVLIASSIGMLTTFAGQYAAHINVNSEFLNLIKATTALVTCSGALVIVMLNIPQLASALSGGASISGIGRTIGRACLDILHKSERARSERPPKPQDASPRNNGYGQSQPARTPLYRRNTIANIRKKS